MEEREKLIRNGEEQLTKDWASIKWNLIQIIDQNQTGKKSLGKDKE